MSQDHKHKKGCGCGHDHHYQPDVHAELRMDELDAGGKFLAEALRLSFGVLKIIMVILLIIFFFSGVFKVGPKELAIVMRFGKVTGTPETRLRQPGAVFSLPYPVDEKVVIPTEPFVLNLNSFWYYQSDAEIAGTQKPRIKPSLDPVLDGYCLTRNDNIEGVVGENDYNIVHTKWQINYKLTKDPYRFFKNIYVRDISPGELYADVIEESVELLIKPLAENAIMKNMVGYSIDEAILTSRNIVPGVKEELQRKLDQIDSGIEVTQVQITKSDPPRQVDDAFQASMKASQTSQAKISEARGYAENVLNEAGGAVGIEILNAIKTNVLPELEIEALWAKLAGKGRENIANARAYRTQVVEDARANWEYMRQLLPEYRKRPELVLQRIYQDAVEEVLENVDEKIFVEPGSPDKKREFRVLLNRDPKIAKTRKK